MDFYERGMEILEEDTKIYQTFRRLNVYNGCNNNSDKTHNNNNNNINLYIKNKIINSENFMSKNIKPDNKDGINKIKSSLLNNKTSANTAITDNYKDNNNYNNKNKNNDNIIKNNNKHRNNSNNEKVNSCFNLIYSPLSIASSIDNDDDEDNDYDDVYVEKIDTSINEEWVDRKSGKLDRKTDEWMDKEMNGDSFSSHSFLAASYHLNHPISTSCSNNINNNNNDNNNNNNNFSDDSINSNNRHKGDVTGNDFCNNSCPNNENFNNQIYYCLDPSSKADNKSNINNNPVNKNNNSRDNGNNNNLTDNNNNTNNNNKLNHCINPGHTYLDKVNVDNCFSEKYKKDHKKEVLFNNISKRKKILALNNNNNNNNNNFNGNNNKYLNNNNSNNNNNGDDDDYECLFESREGNVKESVKPGWNNYLCQQKNNNNKTNKNNNNSVERSHLNKMNRSKLKTCVSNNINMLKNTNQMLTSTPNYANSRANYRSDSMNVNKYNNSNKNINNNNNSYDNDEDQIGDDDDDEPVFSQETISSMNSLLKSFKHNSSKEDPSMLANQLNDAHLRNPKNDFKNNNNNNSNNNNINNNNISCKINSSNYDKTVHTNSDLSIDSLSISVVKKRDKDGDDDYVDDDDDDDVNYNGNYNHVYEDDDNDDEDESIENEVNCSNADEESLNLTTYECACYYSTEYGTLPCVQKKEKKKRKKKNGVVSSPNHRLNDKEVSKKENPCVNRAVKIDKGLELLKGISQNVCKHSTSEKYRVVTKHNVDGFCANNSRNVSSSKGLNNKINPKKLLLNINVEQQFGNTAKVQHYIDNNILVMPNTTQDPALQIEQQKNTKQIISNNKADIIVKNSDAKKTAWESGPIDCSTLGSYGESYCRSLYEMVRKRDMGEIDDDDEELNNKIKKDVKNINVSDKDEKEFEKRENFKKDRGMSKGEEKFVPSNIVDDGASSKSNNDNQHNKNNTSFFNEQIGSQNTINIENISEEKISFTNIRKKFEKLSNGLEEEKREKGIIHKKNKTDNVRRIEGNILHMFEGELKVDVGKRDTWVKIDNDEAHCWSTLSTVRSEELPSPV